MAITIASNVTLSTAANTKTADLITGQYQFVQKGKVTLVARGSAAGMNAQLSVGGISSVSYTHLTLPTNREV